MEFSIFTFPFEQIGGWLRGLSLSGAVGNIIAIALYAGICLSPCVILLWLKKSGRACKVDWLLLLVSAGLWYMLYYMINPGLFVTMLGFGDLAMLGCTFYSVLLGYLVLRILQKSASAGTEALQKGLRILLYVVMVLFGFVAVTELVVELPAKIQALQESNTMVGDLGYGESNLTVTYVLLVLQSIITASYNVLSAAVLFVAAGAVQELLTDAYSDQSVAKVEKVAGLCTKTLAYVVIASMGLNVLQIALRNMLYQIHVSASLPVLLILLVIVILVVARYVRESQKLKRDMDLFI